MKSPLAMKLVDEWRTQFNPLRGLTLQRAVELFESGERGEYPDLQWTYRFVEKRDEVLRACKRRISSALVELDWNIKIPETVPAGDRALAKKQYETLRNAYDRIENLREAFQKLSLADFRGYTHLEKVYDHERIGVNGPWLVKRLEFVPQWHWLRDGIYGPWKFIEDARQTSAKAEGKDIDPDQFIIREVEDPVNEIALIAFIRKSLGQKDWDAFVESYGIPWFFLIMPEGIKPGTSEAEEYTSFVQRAMSDARGALPSGTDAKILSADNQSQPFEPYLKRQDNVTVLAATSSLLTMLTESGSGTLAGGAHQETFDAVARAQALLISEILNEQFDRPLLEAVFPGQPVYAYFELAADDSEDVKDVVENAQKLKQAGYEMDPEDLAERTGYKISKIQANETLAESEVPVDDPGSKPPDVTQQLSKGAISNRWIPEWFTRLFNRETKIEEVPAASLDEAMRKEYQGLYQDLDQISKLPADERLEAMRVFREQLPEHFRDILKSEASVEAIEKLLEDAIYSGATQAAENGRERPITERKLS